MTKAIVMQVHNFPDIAVGSNIQRRHIRSQLKLLMLRLCAGSEIYYLLECWYKNGKNEKLVLRLKIRYIEVVVIG